MYLCLPVGGSRRFAVAQWLSSTSRHEAGIVFEPDRHPVLNNSFTEWSGGNREPTVIVLIHPPPVAGVQLLMTPRASQKYGTASWLL